MPSGPKVSVDRFFLTSDEFKYAPEKWLNGQSEVFYFTAKENSRDHYKHVGTQEIRFGRKTNEIAKFGSLDEKTKFTLLDEIWTKNGQLIAEPNAIRDQGTSKRPPCVERNLPYM